MITTRSLLPASKTAFWTEWNSHCRASLRLSRTSLFAFFLVSSRFGSLGRSRKPFVRALSTERASNFRDRFPAVPMHTT